MARRRVNTTKAEIIRLATKMFLEIGYTATSPRVICDALDLSTGNLTYYFQTKEHLLAVLVEMLCDFQWQTLQNVVQEGLTSPVGVCLELAAMAAMCEDDAIAKEFCLASYTHPLTLEIIRKNDAERAKTVFGAYCSHWNNEDYAEAEILVSGIEYATLMPAGDPVPLETRISGALNTILITYNVPEKIRKEKIEKVLSMDYRAIGKRILKEFKAYVEEEAEKDLK